MNIQPGTTVSVEITKLPTNEAARKTLVRVCCKDPAVIVQRRRLQDRRPSYEFWRRGGNRWNHRMKTTPPVSVRVGQRYSLRATLDVLRDLDSVKRFVKVSAA
ncbi:MAG: hypothetical protein CHACPFDD_02830 [Phycisphaerae bacterium]|nr:hypothetical protein [Phycisphaerae bacterium]